MCCVELSAYVFPLLAKNMAANRSRDMVCINKVVAANEGRIGFDLIGQIHCISRRGCGRFRERGFQDFNENRGESWTPAKPPRK